MTTESNPLFFKILDGDNKPLHAGSHPWPEPNGKPIFREVVKANSSHGWHLWRPMDLLLAAQTSARWWQCVVSEDVLAACITENHNALDTRDKQHLCLGKGSFIGKRVLVSSAGLYKQLQVDDGELSTVVKSFAQKDGFEIKTLSTKRRLQKMPFSEESRIAFGQWFIKTYV